MFKTDKIITNEQAYYPLTTLDWTYTGSAAIYKTVVTMSDFAECGIITLIIKYYDGSTTKYRKLEELYINSSTAYVTAGVEIGDSLGITFSWQVVNSFDIQIKPNITLGATARIDLSASLQRNNYA